MHFRTDSKLFWQIDPSVGYEGITCFLWSRTWASRLPKKEQKLGICASSTYTLNFDDLKVPAENIIGGEGLGYKIAIEILNEGTFYSPALILSHDNILGHICFRSYVYGTASSNAPWAMPTIWAAIPFGQTSGYLPGHGIPDCADRDRTVERAASHVQMPHGERKKGAALPRRRPWQCIGRASLHSAFQRAANTHDQHPHCHAASIGDRPPFFNGLFGERVSRSHRNRRL